jgi:hypothetical protein
MQAILELLQGAYPRQSLDFDAVVPLGGLPDDYRLTEQSSFVDIGSGFGMAVWHAYLVVSCLSIGWEVVPNRHEYATESF